jgi:C-terminal processing protease CtpA/Prc|tara:strand:- start:74 stop:733 length:660 start_codon:yes stop_codon:yes gene_type:complete
MSIQEKVRNIVFYFVKNEYKNYLEQHELKFIPEEDLDKVVDIFYIQKEKTLKEFIRTNLKKMMKGQYPGALVENIIFDIFQDDKLAKNRIILEIQQFQTNADTSLLQSNMYNVEVIPDEKYGMGINLSVDNKRIIVESFKKHPKEDTPLPAEETGLIHEGDELIEIDGQDMKSIKVDKIINILKGMNSKKGVVNIKFYSTKTNELFSSSYNEVRQRRPT